MLTADSGSIALVIQGSIWPNSQMLYENERHQDLLSIEWNSEEAASAIQRILSVTADSFGREAPFWPLHPSDSEGESFASFTDFYFGAAGVLWAYRELKKFRSSESYLLTESIWDKLLEYHLQIQISDSIYETRESLFLGEAGVRFLKEVCFPSSENAIRLKTLLRSHFTSQQNEILYGLPGTLVMALRLFQKTGDLDYQKIYEEGAVRLLASRINSDGLQVWSQQMGPTARCYIGAAHGSIGNYGVLLQGLKVFPNDRHKQELVGDIESLLERTALTEKNFTNWPLTIDNSSPKRLVQWCHGSPGIITALASVISPSESTTIHRLLLQAAELTWQIGALAKGTSLCHGTAGNGMALLKMYEYTGDELWLSRARAFAMHAIKQNEFEIREARHPRISLWTGDLGLALYLRDAVRGRTELPGLDFI